MTEEEFERLRRRFGADVSAWPAPHRQEALGFPGEVDETANEDGDLDRLVLESAVTETDEHKLARKVMARIANETRPASSILPAGMWRPWQLPLAASGFAAVLIVAAVAGYMVADPGEGALDDSLLAFALGQSGGDGPDAGTLDMLGGGSDGEDSL